MEGAPTEGDQAVLTASAFATQLHWYYSRFFPMDEMWSWLSYGDKDYFARREISFTLAGDVYLRFRSFQSASDLQGVLKDRTPVKIDIGAVYNLPPKDRAIHGAALTPLEKELVIDIDMTDYKDVMGDLADGSELEVCDNNWPYMAAAVKIIDRALREDFGFRHILWVYSGRRGVHCWVADQSARQMSNEVRSSVVAYLSVKMNSQENAGRKVDDVTNPLHPSLLRAKREVCDPLFQSFVLEEQGMLSTDERVRRMLSYVSDRSVRENLTSKLTTNSGAKLSGMEKWNRIRNELLKHNDTRALADYIVFHYTYPRLDVNVSRDLGHLLKAPFSVHPKTGRVCVPFRAAESEVFRPATAAPRIQNLIDEVNGKVLEDGPKASDLLQAGIDVLNEFRKPMQQEAMQAARREKLAAVDRQSAMEFMSS